MLAAIRSCALQGVEAVAVTVEVDVAQGLPQWCLVGLAASAVRESRERVQAALANAGLAAPQRRVTVNLAPADTPKTGTALDLPIALGVLVATRQLPPSAVADVVAVGELGLDGSLRPVRGILPMAQHLRRAGGAGTLIVPPANVDEALLALGPSGTPRVVTAERLDALVAGLARGGLVPATARARDIGAEMHTPDLADVVGQPAARRALEIAAAGAHNLLFAGPPGAGKTMLARRLPGILPPLDDDARLDVLAIHSVAGLLTPARLASREPPFRAPHHSTSVAGLVGGGTGPRPGEVSLAHRGVLLLDELLEAPRHVLDALRQPLEDGVVAIARASQSIRFPARFQLVAATNPCPCGRLGDPDALCTCLPSAVARYRARLSGPLADRIDVHVTVGRVPVAALSAGDRGEPSAVVRRRVLAARAARAARPTGATDRSLDAEARARLTHAAERLRLSARAFHRVVRVARTIADLDGRDAVRGADVLEALAYRPQWGGSDGAVRASAS